MEETSHPDTAMPPARLGVDGLPNLTSDMHSGSVYALIVSTPPARYPLLAASLHASLRVNRACSIIVASHPAQVVDRLQSFGQLDVHPLLESGALSIFEMQEEFSKKMFRYGADSFVKELESLEIQEDSYLVVDQADDLLALHDVSLALEQLDVLRKWFEQKRVTALLAFSRAGVMQAESINALMDNLQGLVRLNAGKLGLDLTFDYWQSPEGTVAARNFHLKAGPTGLYLASAETGATQAGTLRSENDPQPSPEDERYFFYMDPDLAGLAQQYPGIWQRVDTLFGMMHATRGRAGATIVLTFRAGTPLRHLAEAVHTLRLGLGKYVRIVVQEKNASLRYQNEALLLRLGVNLVVHRDVPTVRFPLLLESLRGQVFSRDVNIDFEAALASVLPTRLRGYLVPERFIREVGVVLARAETLNIPCALVAGRPTTSRKMADIISTSTVSRAGDLITADSEQCFLFLHACPQSALPATLQRILGMPVEETLEDVRYLVTRSDIDMELSALTLAGERGLLPDYSSLIPGLPEVEAPAATPEEILASASQLLPPPVDTYTPSIRVQVKAPSPAAAPPGIKESGKREVRRAVRSMSIAPAQTSAPQAVSE